VVKKYKLFEYPIYYIYLLSKKGFSQFYRLFILPGHKFRLQVLAPLSTIFQL